MHELITDEYTALSSQYTQYIKINKVVRPYRNHYIVMTDESPVFASAAKAFSALKPSIGRFKAKCTEVSVDSAASFSAPGSRNDTSLFVAFADSMEKKYESTEAADRFIAALDSFISGMKAYKDSRCAVCVTVPMPQQLDGGVLKLAEREYLAWLAANADDHRAAFVQRITDLCRSRCREDDLHIVLYFFDNIIAPDCASISFDGLDPAAMVREAMSTGEVSVCDEDYRSFFGCTYIRDVYAAVLYGMSKVKKGHIYNVSAMHLSTADLKLALAKAHSDCLRLSCSRNSGLVPSHTGLDPLKFDSRFFSTGGFERSVDAEEMMYRLGCICLDKNYDMGRMLEIYNGKLDRVKAVEFNMLKKFDEICRRHNIQYFVAAGTLLGAVRHHDVIPWDDDFDIGMLREDYVKLCKVLDSELPEDYIFCHPGNGSKSEYWIDKIRLRETYYTTQYFDNFTVPDGVFLDIFVYDKTSNNKKKQYAHILSINAIALMISTKWTNGPRPGRHYKLTKFMHPFLKLVPMKLLHRLFDWNAARYSKRKDSKYVVDTVGLNIGKGAFPLDCVDEITYIDFLGMQVPIPKNYEGYLSHFYSKNYMSLPPVSSRVSGHSFRRLDFGEYLYSDEYTGAVPRIDVRGELYEIPTEKKHN